MADLNSLIIFARIVEANSFSEAARRLKLPVSTVSRRMAELEERLGVRLLERSTRGVRMTETGAELLEHAKRGAELSDAVDNIVSNQLSEVSGALRLSAPPSISDTLLAPIVSAFQAKYSDVRIHVRVTDRWVDHISEGVDLVFRRGPLKNSSLVARPVLTYRHQLVASPGYLSRCKPPEHPSDLLYHRLLTFAHWKQDNRWFFVRADGKEQETLSFQPHLSMNDYTGLAAALVGGAEIGELPPVVEPALLREGRLVEAMPAWRFPTLDLCIVHLGNRLIPRPVRAFTDFAAAKAGELFPVLPV